MSPLLTALVLLLPLDKAPAEGKTEPAPLSAPAAKLAKQAQPAIVVVTVTGRDGKEHGLGSGFVVGADGLIATNLHVIGEARPIKVQLADGKVLPVTIVHASDRTLDLALLRIEAKGLPVLELGDSDGLKNGQPVVALGHPRGLKNSVVSGVVSGRPTIDDRQMIQLAIPIEPGNSGGPVLDVDGRVQGIVTLKSQVTPNLGFAMPVNALKSLLRKPNPIPIERWVTIGKLNQDEWTTVFEGRWRQRNGLIAVDGPGSGFGGRTLCLSHSAVPARPFEVAVTVKLGNEAGAAGLVFHADGSDKHYGFYPSAGKLRLSRFEGPDVLTWHVLEQKDSPHYRPGDWNRLKVRVEKDRFLCYVNDELVIESNDQVFTEGKVGLAKFRDTHAEFKQFQIGTKLPLSRPTAELTARIRKLIDGLPPEGQPGADIVAKLTPEATASMAALERQAQLLEKQAAQLRQLAQTVHEQRLLDELAKATQGDDAKIDLVHAALLLSRLDNPDLDVDAYRKQVDRLGKEITAAVPKDADDKARLATLNRELFEQRGFHGSRSDYYNRANSYLNEVLDDREGLPITLSLLYLELAQRLGLKMVGIGLPGHFVVQYQPAKGEPQLIDVYEGAKHMTRAEADRKVRGMTGKALRPEHLQPVGKRAILLRMLQNLAAASERAEHETSQLRYQSAILVLAPDSTEERLRRAGIRFRLGDRTGALQDIDRLLEQAPEGVNRERLLELRQMIERSK
jgi:regulator of sirC expression with transglutaminase-like and TPR domain